MSQKSRQETLSDQEIDAILRGFLKADMTIEDAEKAIARLHADRRRASQRLLHMLDDSSQHRDTVIALLGSLGDSSAIQPLTDMVFDESIDDDLKLKVISVISQLDPATDTSVLLDKLQDPREAVLRNQREHLKRLRSPGDLALWLEVMEQHMPPQAREAFVWSCAELDDAAVVPLLICMCYDPNDQVALIAMDAVERFKDRRALPALEELAAHHPVQEMRDEAARAADRLRVRASLVRQIVPLPVDPLYACYLTTIDGAGEQALLMARQRPDGTVRLVDVMFNDHKGIKQCSGADVSVDELESFLDAFADEGISPVRVSHQDCLTALDLACEATWESGRLLPMSFVAWRVMIQGEGAEEKAEQPVLAVLHERRTARLEHCHELLLQDEFASWFFNPDEIDDLVGRYLDLAEEQGGTIGPSALRRLLERGAIEIVTDRTRGLIRGRLRRMAPLLRELYEEDEVWEWAVIAADALETDSALPVEEHPLLLGMVACSLENAIGEPVAWFDAT